MKLIIKSVDTDRLFERIEEHFPNVESIEDIEEDKLFEVLHSEYFQTEIDEEREKEAEDGDAYAQYVMAWCYLNRKDKISAMKWIEKSANQGYYEAEVLLVSLCALDDPTEIKPMMISERVRWDLKDFTLFDVAYTHQRLADLYFKGIGVEKNQETAMRWATQLAEEGCAAAQYLLAKRYGNGDCVEQDLDQAFSWAKKAADHGDCDALNLLANVARMIDSQAS